MQCFNDQTPSPDQLLPHIEEECHAFDKKAFSFVGVYKKRGDHVIHDLLF